MPPNCTHFPVDAWTHCFTVGSGERDGIVCNKSDAWLRSHAFAVKRAFSRGNTVFRYPATNQHAEIITDCASAAGQRGIWLLVHDSTLNADGTSHVIAAQVEAQSSAAVRTHQHDGCYRAAPVRNRWPLVGAYPGAAAGGTARDRHADVAIASARRPSVGARSALCGGV